MIATHGKFDNITVKKFVTIKYCGKNIKPFADPKTNVGRIPLH